MPAADRRSDDGYIRTSAIGPRCGAHGSERERGEGAAASRCRGPRRRARVETRGGRPGNGLTWLASCSTRPVPTGPYERDVSGTKQPICRARRRTAPTLDTCPIRPPGVRRLKRKPWLFSFRSLSLSLALFFLLDLFRDEEARTIDTVSLASGEERQ